MTSHQGLSNHDNIVVGRQLQFSVYSAEGKLLLAKGQVIESEHVRDQLIASGKFQSAGSDLELNGAANAFDNTPLIENPLDIYARDFHSAVGSSRIGVRASRDETGESYPCWVVGADELYGLIVTAPTKPDRSIVPVSEGQ